MPRRFGPYLLAECLGAGGMAAVYKGKRRHVSGHETPVVVKALLPEHRRNARFIRLFRDEARLTSQLAHANVVRVHDFGAVGDTPYLEMEDLSGWNLEQVWSTLAARGQRLPVSIALTIISDACRGLAYVHSFVDDAGIRRPIIHRDVSPANVMICRDGAVKLVDFGLAKLTRGETLKIDTFLGKLAYMSPEQLDRHQLDRRADVFALGVTLYELLTGRRLFAGANDVDTLQRLQKLVVEPPSRLNPEVPAALDVVVLRAIHRDPDERYPSAAEMMAALDALALPLATRAQLLSYLGTLAPDVFAHACDECGAKIAWGEECASCTTKVDDAVPVDEAAIFDGNEPIPLTALVASPPSPSPAARIDAYLRRRWLILVLTLQLLWRRADAWLAEKRVRA